MTLAILHSLLGCSDVKPESAHDRIKSGFSECDRVLGGGFVKGEVILLSGQPGAGKSTLCLGIANNIASSGKKVVYVSGEEFVEQIAIRGKRMEVDGDNIILSHETRAELVIAYCEEYKPTVCIVDFSANTYCWQCFFRSRFYCTV